jgi:hypothetical protein
MKERQPHAFGGGQLYRDRRKRLLIGNGFSFPYGPKAAVDMANEFRRSLPIRLDLFHL